jgi:hypothetical protein
MTIKSRIEKLEAQQPEPKQRSGFAPSHRMLRLLYGDGLEYTPDELAALDSVPVFDDKFHKLLEAWRTSGHVPTSPDELRTRIQRAQSRRR